MEEWIPRRMIWEELISSYVWIRGLEVPRGGNKSKIGGTLKEYQGNRTRDIKRRNQKRIG